jgi:4-diphosphocytidyl-2-C-methyl-D-erythritol kinase
MNDGNIPTDERNLAHRAAALFFGTYGIDTGLHIYIEKKIPVFAGLGGGSSDAACVLRWLYGQYRPEADKSERIGIALKVGADVPYLLYGGTALVEGIGEIVTPLPPLPEMYVLLVVPHIGAKTAEVFREHKILQTDYAGKVLTAKGIGGIISAKGNALEVTTARMCPIINKIKEILPNCAMSGAGTAMYGLYDEMESAEGAKTRVLDALGGEIAVYITKTYPGGES